MSTYRRVGLLATIMTIAACSAGFSEEPPLNAEELSIVSQVSARALERPLTDQDLSSLRAAHDLYKSRTGASWTKSQAQNMLAASKLISEYNWELGRCILQSIDGGQPFISNKYLKLRAEMEKAGYVRISKLDDDRKSIIAAADGKPWVDEFGQEYGSTSRGSVLEGLRNLEMIQENMGRMAALVLEQARD